MIFCSTASAECYVTYDNKTNEIIDFSPDNAIVMQKGWTQIALPNDVPDYTLAYHATNYKYKNGKFIMNIKKVSDEAIKEEKQIKKAERLDKINKKMQEIAEKALIDAGELEVE